MFSLVRFFPETPRVPFMKLRLGALAFSALMMIGSVVALSTMGLNLGIDFKGGVAINYSSDDEIELDRVRSVVSALNLGDVQVQGASDAQRPNAVIVRVEDIPGETNAEGETETETASANRVAQLVDAALQEEFPDIRRDAVETVGAKVADELVRNGLISLGLALALMLVYIWFRFEWQFSLGAVIALVHDVVITLGVFAIIQMEFNLSIIAAILTIIGYSMNDTVVVYDRIREKMRKFKKMPLVELLNLAINKTLSRTILTSVTTLIALVSLFLLGGAVLQGFSFAMIWGIIIGTYSSIFVAAPLLLFTGVNREQLLNED